MLNLKCWTQRGARYPSAPRPYKNSMIGCIRNVWNFRESTLFTFFPTRCEARRFKGRKDWFRFGSRRANPRGRLRQESRLICRIMYCHFSRRPGREKKRWPPPSLFLKVWFFKSANSFHVYFGRRSKREKSSYMKRNTKGWQMEASVRGSIPPSLTKL